MKRHKETSMHSSRMRTARLLTVSGGGGGSAQHWEGSASRGAAQPGEGESASRGVAQLRGGGVFPTPGGSASKEGSTQPRGVCIQGGLHRGKGGG